MKVVGLAGVPGSGKSAAARCLCAGEGIACVELDEIAWDTYNTRSNVFWQLLARFGSTVLSDDGSIDRGKLADVAFSDASALADLNSIVHPAVFRRLTTMMEGYKLAGTQVLLVEGALLASSKFCRMELFDIVLWLDVSEDTARKRLQRDERIDHSDRLIGEPCEEGVVRISGEGTVKQVAERIVQVIG